MTYGLHAYGAREFGRAGLVAIGPARAYGGAVYGSQFYGFANALAGAITGSAIAVGGSALGTVGGYAVISCPVGINGAVDGQITLTGVASGDIGIEASAAAEIHLQGAVSGDVAIGGTAAGYITLDGDITGDAIGIGGEVFGFAGAVPSYDRVGARLITAVARGRITTDTGRGRLVTNTVKGRF